MFGINRALATAGWGSSEDTARFNAEGTFDATVTLPYDGAWELGTTNLAMNDNWMSADQFTVDITGLTSETGYNQRRYAATATFYMPSTPPTTSSGYLSALFTYNSGTNLYFNVGLTNNGDGTMKFGGAFANFIYGFDFNYSEIANEWVQLWCCGAETSSAFTDWNGFGFGDNYNRFLLIRLRDNTVISQYDFQDPATRPDYSTFGNTVYGGGFNNSEPEIDVGQFCSGGDNGSIKSIGGCWWFGHTIDVLGTNSNQILGRPNGTVDNKKAWINGYWDDIDNPSVNNYYTSHSPNANDRYSESNDRLWWQNQGAGESHSTYYTQPADLKIGTST